VERLGDVFLLDLGDGENRFHPDWIASVNAGLDEVEKAGGGALVTAARGKFFSNGLDLDWLGAHPDRRGDYLTSVHELLARMLSLPMVTVAALQGHTFAAGAMFALAHDVRVMRADRGFWCLPEADIGIPFSRGMSALIQSRLSARTAHEAMVTARRYGGADAADAGIVDHAVPEEAVRPAAVEIAQSHAGKAGPALALIKSRMYAEVLDRLRAPESPAG
jgi:enoyl-CoA hydratase/carnithine racemase